MTAISTLAALPDLPPCLAYVGPGPGLTMIWALVGLLATLFVALSAIALWPIRALLRRWRQRRAKTEFANDAGR
jgi:hypothetical protein